MSILQPGYTLHGKAYDYEIEQMLGQGSFGITYLAKIKLAGALGTLDSSIRVAIKEFFMKEINGREGSTVTCSNRNGLYDKYRVKFSREAENLSRLQHPNIVKVLELFEANNTVYYAMEYIDGGSLNDWIEQHNGLPESEAIDYLRQIGSALSYMHDHKMLHLDLKPSNIMRNRSGSGILIDFGLSKQYDENGIPESSTTIGGGTPGYAPIEQMRYREGAGLPVTMDVYALGATVFKMLTGQRPPEASDLLNDGFPAGELRQRGVSETTIAAVEKAMAPLKAQRYQSVNEFLQMFGGSLSFNYNDESTTIDDISSEDKNRPTATNVELLTTGPNDYISTNRSNHLLRIFILFLSSICAIVLVVVLCKVLPNNNIPQIEQQEPKKPLAFSLEQQILSTNIINISGEKCHFYQGEFYYKNNTYPVMLAFIERNNKIEKAIYKNVTYGGKIILNCQLTNNEIILSGKDEVKDFSMQLSVGENDLLLGSATNGDIKTTVRLMPTTNTFDITNKDNVQSNKTFPNDIFVITQAFLSQFKDGAAPWNCLKNTSATRLSKDLENDNTPGGIYMVRLSVPFTINGKPLIENQIGETIAWDVFLRGHNAGATSLMFSATPQFIDLKNTAKKIAAAINAAYISTINADYGDDCVLLYSIKGKNMNMRLAIYCSYGTHGGTIEALIGETNEVDRYTNACL